MRLKTLLILTLLSFPAATFAEDTNDTMKLVMGGTTLLQPEADKLEKALLDAPDDIDTRAFLLGYYFLKANQSDSMRASRAKHVLWWIEKHPESDIAGSPYLALNMTKDGVDFNAAKSLWIKQAEAHKDNARIVGNAGKFFAQQPKEAEKYLQQAKALEPDNPEWSRELSQLHQREMLSRVGEDRKRISVQALNELETAHKLDKDADGKFYKLDDLAKLSLESEDYIKAKNYAGQTVQSAESHPKDWNFGNAIHQGNLVLGRLALRDGKIEEAKKYLKLAGETPGSPQLNTFGPNMTLAKELLEKGEKTAVLDYLDNCGKFWTMGQAKLTQWKADITAGRDPQFGANLNF